MFTNDTQSPPHFFGTFVFTTCKILKILRVSVFERRVAFLPSSILAFPRARHAMQILLNVKGKWPRARLHFNMQTS